MYRIRIEENGYVIQDEEFQSFCFLARRDETGGSVFARDMYPSDLIQLMASQSDMAKACVKVANLVCPEANED